MSITLAEIRVQARQRADMQNSSFVSDSEANNYINSSIAELHDILCEAYGSEYFVKSLEFPIAAGTPTYALPTDFYEVKGVDIKMQPNGHFINVKRFNFNERNRYSDLVIWDLAGLTNVRYRVVGNNLMFNPNPSQDATVKLWYVPVATKLVNDSDSLDDQNAYAEYVVVDTAIKMMQKEESDVRVLMAQKQALEKRIRDKSQNRDAAEAPTISDATAENDDYYYRNGN